MGKLKRCDTCRRLGKGCDLAWPTCSRCESRNEPCVYANLPPSADEEEKDSDYDAAPKRQRKPRPLKRLAPAAPKSAVPKPADAKSKSNEIQRPIVNPVNKPAHRRAIPPPRCVDVALSTPSTITDTYQLAPANTFVPQQTLPLVYQPFLSPVMQTPAPLAPPAPVAIMPTSLNLPWLGEAAGIWMMTVEEMNRLQASLILYAREHGPEDLLLSSPWYLYIGEREEDPRILGAHFVLSDDERPRCGEDDKVVFVHRALLRSKCPRYAACTDEGAFARSFSRIMHDTHTGSLAHLYFLDYLYSGRLATTKFNQDARMPNVADKDTRHFLYSVISLHKIAVFCEMADLVRRVEQAINMHFHKYGVSTARLEWALYLAPWMRYVAAFPQHGPEETWDNTITEEIRTALF